MNTLLPKSITIRVELDMNKISPKEILSELRTSETHIHSQIWSTLISLTDVLRRLFEAILLGSVNAWIGRLSIEQGGFRGKRGTMDQIAVLQEWITRCKASRKDRLHFST